MSKTVATVPFLLELLERGITASAASLTIVLGTNVVSPARGSVIGDITEPTYTGYAPAAVAWDSVSFDPAVGTAEVIGNSILKFTGPSDSTGQDIISVGVAYPGAGGPPPTGDYLAGLAMLDSPVSLLAPTDQLNIVLNLKGDGTISVEQV